ncbi:MAG: hypothetical protein M1816_000115 [Peltula sp. TS41687]|nr:MAG: hypothetical protein M1816_000115 [Peltula sp. TS41687]
MATATGTKEPPQIDEPAEMVHPSPTMITPDTHLTANYNDHEGPVREKLKKTSIGTFPKSQTEDAGVQENDQDQTEAKSPAEEPSLNSVEPHHESDDGIHSKNSTISEKAPEKSIAQEESEKSKSSEDDMKDVTGDDSHSSDPEAGHERKEQSGQAATGVQLSSKTRSSESTTPDSTGPAETMDEDTGARIMPPRRKRSRDQVDNDDSKEPEKATAGEDPSSGGSEDAEKDTQAGTQPARTVREEPEKKRHRDISQGSVSSSKEAIVNKIPMTSGFSNTSATSPFGALAATSTAGSTSVFGGKPSAEAKPPATSFVTSGFGALTGSATSSFGALGGVSTAPSGFGSLAASVNKGSSDSLKDASSGKKFGAFGGSVLSAPSAFGGETSAFGKLGGGLGGGFGAAGGGKLTTFASKGGAGIIGLSETPAKPFGAPDEEEYEDEEGESDDEEVDGDLEAGGKELKEDRKFHHHEIETGEEGEETRFSARAKLYFFDSAGKAWKERGYGMLKLNVSAGGSKGKDDLHGEDNQVEKVDEASQDEGASQKPQARLLMRSEGVFRVVLNVPIFQGMKAGDQNGNVPSDRCLKFTAFEDEKHVMMQLRFNNNATASELWRHIKAIQKEL